MYCMKCKKFVIKDSRSCPKCNSAVITISAIVPCYNEEKTVREVIEVLLNSQYIDEIIAINDGSTDETYNILKGFGNKIHFINLKKNKGKGNALVEGIKKSKGDIVIFLDADFTNLKATHIKTILKPILNMECRIVIGYQYNRYTFNKSSSDISGQRVYYKKDLLPYLNEMAKTKFGVETYLNNTFPKEDTKKIELENLTTLYKYEKYDPATALTEYIKEGLEITKALAQKETLNIKDKQILSKILEVKDMKDLQDLIAKITNTKIKTIFEKYILQYIKGYKADKSSKS